MDVVNGDLCLWECFLVIDVGDNVVNFSLFDFDGNFWVFNVIGVIMIDIGVYEY